MVLNESLANLLSLAVREPPWMSGTLRKPAKNPILL